MFFFFCFFFVFCFVFVFSLKSKISYLFIYLFIYLFYLIYSFYLYIFFLFFFEVSLHYSRENILSVVVGKNLAIGSVGCAVRLETRRSRVQPPPRSATFFRGD